MVIAAIHRGVRWGLGLVNWADIVDVNHSRFSRAIASVYFYNEVTDNFLHYIYILFPKGVQFGIDANFLCRIEKPDMLSLFEVSATCSTIVLFLLSLVLN